MSGLHGLDLEDLRVLHAVAATGSFTAAAESLHYTQSGVSRRMAHLERVVGGALFARLPRGVRLTALGSLLACHAEEVLRRLDVLAEDVETMRTGTGGRLRVGSFPTANASLTPAALQAFRADHPAVALSTFEALTPALLRMVVGGNLDAAVVSDYPTGSLPAEAAGADLVELVEDPLLVALPLAHPLADAAQVSLADLAEESWISGSPDGVDTVLAVSTARAGFDPRIGVRVASWTSKLSYVAAGFGLTIVPRLLAPAVPPTIVLKSLADDLPARHVYAALPEQPTQAARDFVGALRRS